MKNGASFHLITLFIQFERTFHQSTGTSKFSAPLIERSKCDSPRIQIGKSQLDKHNLHLMGKNASSISSWSFLINLRTSEKAKLFEHFYPFSWILSRWHWWCCSSRGNPGSPQTSTFPLETKRCQINFLRSAMTKFPRILNWILLQEIAHSLFTLQKLFKFQYSFN